MASYTYKATTFEGKVVEGTMEASDHAAVSLKLQEMGLLPIKIGSSSEKSLLSREIEWPWRKKKVVKLIDKNES